MCWQTDASWFVRKAPRPQPLSLDWWGYSWEYYLFSYLGTVHPKITLLSSSTHHRILFCWTQSYLEECPNCFFFSVQRKAPKRTQNNHFKGIWMNTAVMCLWCNFILFYFSKWFSVNSDLNVSILIYLLIYLLVVHFWFNAKSVSLNSDFEECISMLFFICFTIIIYFYGDLNFNVLYCFIFYCFIFMVHVWLYAKR